MTVSRALTGKSDISAVMKARVIKCAESLGYQPNRWARTLVTRRSNMIGVVVPEIAHNFFADVISGIEEVLDAANYDLLLCHTRSDPDRERMEIQTLVGNHIDGLIVAPVQHMKSPDLYLDLQKQRLPFVLFDRFFPGFDFSSVCLDDFAAGAIAGEFLIGLGHSRIAHIGDSRVSPGALRRRGFLSALRKAKLPADTRLILQTPLEMDAGRRATEKLLRRESPPTAIFAANDQLALGAIYACREAGLRIPQDISVMGAGNIEGAYHPSPFLTTIDWPRPELGRIAARLLLQALAGESPGAPQTHVFQPIVLSRHSTAAYNGRGAPPKRTRK